MNALARRLSQQVAALERRRGARDRATTLREQFQQTVRDLEDELSVQTDALAICKEIESAWQKSFEQDLADVVSQGMTLVFERPIQLEIESSFQRDSSAVAFVLYENGMRMPILGYKGGGYVNVVSFLLRALLLLNARPALRKILILDEAFENVSSEFTPNVSVLLRKMCDETGVQIILVTQKPELGEFADFVYEVSQRKGVSSVELLDKGSTHLYDEGAD